MRTVKPLDTKVVLPSARKRETSQVDLSLVIPLFNEEENVATVTRSLWRILMANHVDFEIILIDNGSWDGTGKEIDKIMVALGERIVKVFVPVNGGFGWGVINGLRNCRGNFVGFLTGNLQIASEDVIRLYNFAKQNPDCLIKAVRVIRHDGSYRRILSFFYNLLIRLLFGIDIRDANATPKIFRKEYLDLLQLEFKRSFFDAELLIKWKYVNHKIIDIPTEYKKRRVGKAKTGLAVILGLLFDQMQFRVKGFERWKKRFARSYGKRLGTQGI